MVNPEVFHVMLVGADSLQPATDMQPPTGSRETEYLLAVPAGGLSGDSEDRPGKGVTERCMA